jgi:phosphatidylglycerol:prolipoprotein diacylglycerol transferase
MFLYAVSRFIIEFYRGDPRGTVFGVLSTSQFISVVLGPLALIMLVWLSKLRPTAPQEQKTRRRVAA